MCISRRGGYQDRLWGGRGGRIDERREERVNGGEERVGDEGNDGGDSWDKGGGEFILFLCVSKSGTQSARSSALESSNPQSPLILAIFLRCKVFVFYQFIRRYYEV
jgi:hypothetical protein